MENIFKAKIENVINLIISDPRWNIESELMIQVLGFTLFGYAFGVGRIVCFMDVEDIKIEVIYQLTKLGVGKKYAQGMIDQAYSLFINEDQRSVQGQLIGVGHSHFSSENLDELKESIFNNTGKLTK